MNTSRPRHRPSRQTTVAPTGLCLVAVALVMTMAACTNGDSHAAATPVPFERPLTQYFQWMDQDRDQRMRLALDGLNRGQELVAACMAKEGFEYQPQPATAANIRVVIPTIVADHLTITQARSDGYGIVGEPRDDLPPEPTLEPDPAGSANEAYRDSLTPSEQEDYDTTLWGDDTEPRAADGAYLPNGCHDTAMTQVSIEQEPLGSDEFSALADDVYALMAEEDTGPDMAAVLDDWLACMEDAGYPDLTSPTDAAAKLTDKAAALRRGGSRTPSTAELEALRDEEIATAVADATCRVSVDYQTRRQAVIVDLENTFISSHGDELERYRDAQGQG